MASRIDPRLHYSSSSTPYQSSPSSHPRDAHYHPHAPPPVDTHYQYHHPYHTAPAADPRHRAESLPLAQSAASVSPHQQPHPYYNPNQPHASSQHADSPYAPQHQQGDESPVDASFQDPNDPNDPNDPKRIRACESCRGLKVRCDRSPTDLDKPCLRCAKAKRPCIVTEPSRKRQKKTDSRVAELERKLERLSALLPAHVQDLDSDAQRNGQPTPDSPASPQGPKKQSTASPGQESSGSELREFVATHRERKWSGSVASSSDKKFRPPHATVPEGCGNADLPDAETPEPVSTFVNRRIGEVVDEATAARIFDHYVTDMAVHMPAVVFPPGTRSTTVHKEKPLVFLAVLVASSVGMAPAEMQVELHALLLSTLADSVIGNVEKRLDVVQALLVSTIWYRPPRRYEQMNFYALAHAAAVMGMDLGLGRRTKSIRAISATSTKPRPTPSQIPLATDSLEARRTWLGCYFQCATISMSLRRPILIRWSTYLEESVELLESSRDALDSDKLLCQHVRLQHLNEEIGQRFSMDDPSALVNITDSKIQEALHGFEHSLQSWRKSAESLWHRSLKGSARASQAPSIPLTLEISEKVTSLYMHELGLHSGHNVDDFRSPFTEDMLRAGAGQGLELSPAHSKALLDCLRAVHNMFDIFFCFDLEMVKALPIFFFVRIAYAVVVLVRLHFAVMAPDSEIRKLISAENVSVERYLGKLLDIFQIVHSQDSFRPATKFLVMVKRLYHWFQETKEGGAAKGTDRKAAKATGMKRHRVEPQQIQRVQPLDMHASTPLDLLSQVATANAGGEANRSADQGGQASAQQAVADNSANWYYNDMMNANHMMTPGAGEIAMGMDFGQAIDLTLNGVMDETAELSWLFMNPAFGNEGGYQDTSQMWHGG